MFDTNFRSQFVNISLHCEAAVSIYTPATWQIPHAELIPLRAVDHKLGDDQGELTQTAPCHSHRGIMGFFQPLMLKQPHCPSFI